jgi:flagellar assembly factor FliW
VGSEDREPDVTIELPRFGACRYRESDVLEFPWGLPGFAALRRFLPIALDGEDGCIWLQSLDDVAVALPTVDAASDAATLPSYALDSLELHDATEWMTLRVIADGNQSEDAPIVVNLGTRRARQIVLEPRGQTAKRTVPLAAAGA